MTPAPSAPGATSRTDDAELDLVGIDDLVGEMVARAEGEGAGSAARGAAATDVLARRGLPSLLDHAWWPWVVGLVAAFTGARALSDNSFMTHLATGRLILDGSVPMTDRFTWASEGTPLVAHSWGSSVLYALGDAVGSGAGVRAMIAVFCCVGMLALWRLSAPAEANVARLGLVAMSLVLGFGWWNERPQTVAYMALALGLVIVAERRSPWWLVPLFALWTNLHGSWAMGVPFLGVLMFLRVVEGRSIGRREVAEVSAMVAGIGIAGALNPYGWDLIVFPVEQLRRDAIQLIAEWQPLDLGTVWAQVFVVLAAASVGVLAWRRRWLRLAIAVGFVWLAFDANRYAPLSAIMFVPLVAPALAGVGTPAPAVRRPRRLAVGASAIGAAAVLGWIALSPSYDLSAYPTAEAAAMESRGWLGVDRDRLPRILTHDWVGNWLEWRNGVEAKPWIDDRAEVHDYDTVHDYAELLGEGREHAAIVERHAHDVVLWRSDESFADLVRSDARWRVVSETDDWLVACVVESPFCAP